MAWERISQVGSGSLVSSLIGVFGALGALLTTILPDRLSSSQGVLFDAALLVQLVCTYLALALGIAARRGFGLIAIALSAAWTEEDCHERTQRAQRVGLPSLR